MKKLTDEQLDLVVKKLLQDSALDSENLNEIADSPQILWNIKRKINQEKTKTSKGWIWDFKFLIPSFAAFSLLFAFGMFWFFNVSKNNENDRVSIDLPKVEPVKSTEPQISNEVNPIQSQNPISVEKTKSSNIVKPTKSKQFSVKDVKVKQDSVKLVQVKNVSKIAATPKSAPAKQPQKTYPKTSVRETKSEEYKTDFISLSYLPTPESGQIVRVKVPRAMMVSLGVTNNVSKNDELVNAEVIIGDDGTSRAIRFISDGK